MRTAGARRIALLIMLASLTTIGAGEARRGCDECRMNLELTQSTFRLVIRKQERRLLVYQSNGEREELHRTFRIALGSQPIGTKTRQGDGATPEGDYYITHRNAASKYHLSLGVSYPNVADAESGLARGLITRRQYQSIVRAIGRLEKPLQNTALGGDVFIHGGGSSTDWTAGCVALDNQAIEELFERLPLKTPVTIVP